MSEIPEADGDAPPPRRRDRVLDHARLLAGALAGAAALTLLGIPAGAIIGAVIGSALANAGRSDVQLTPAVRVGGLVLLGCGAGVQLDAGTLDTLWGLALPLIVSLAVMLVGDFLLALVLAKRFKVDLVTAVFACAPGGVSELAVAAEAAGARIGIVMAVQVGRVALVVLGVLPILVMILADV